MARELACADGYNKNNLGGFFSDYDLFRMVTVDAAGVVGAGTKIGTLAVGYFADIAIWKDNGKTDAFDAVVHARVGDTALVVRGGKVLAGESDVVKELSNDDAGCEEVDVCGTPTRVCSKRDTGKTIAEIRTSLEGAIAKASGHPPLYDLIFCGVPTDEPSCVPARAGEFTGVPADDDSDGDGIKNDTDLCPTIFSAVRPLDGGKQADADGDKVGDICDACPLKADSADCPLVSGDADADGSPDNVDNCDNVANPGQEDQDGDKKGDVCDACPDVANPGPAACPVEAFTIPEIRALASPKGTAVTIADVVVTAVKVKTGTYTFWVQDKTAKENAGLLVFAPMAKVPVQVGDVLDIAGELDEFHAVLELVKPVVTVKSSAPLTIAPVVVDPASVKAGGTDVKKYMSMFLAVEAVTVTNDAAGAKPTDDELEVTGGLHLDDFVFDYAAATYPTGTVFTKVLGPLHIFDTSVSLLPRSADDLVK